MSIHQEVTTSIHVENKKLYSLNIKIYAAVISISANVS
jgi:hypothetical protein